MGKELRRERRIPRSELPEDLHHLIMVFDTGEETPVTTFDASTMGLGLEVPLPVVAFDDNVGVLLRPANNGFQLIGEIVFVIGHEPGKSRLGIQFTQTIAVQKYLELLDPDEKEA